MRPVGPSWTEQLDAESGCTYFFNSKTGESRWKLSGTGLHGATVLDDEWTLVTDDAAVGPFYYNTRTKESSWEAPPHITAIADAGGASPKRSSVPSSGASAPSAPTADPTMWIEHTDSAGALYYYNASTHARRSTAPQPAEGCVWGRYLDVASGAVYFFDPVSGGSMWLDDLKRILRVAAERGTKGSTVAEPPTVAAAVAVAASPAAAPDAKPSVATKEPAPGMAQQELVSEPTKTPTAAAGDNEPSKLPASKPRTAAPMSRLARMKALRAKKQALGIDPDAVRKKKLAEELDALRAVRDTIRSVVHDPEASGGDADAPQKVGGDAAVAQQRFARDVISWNPRADMDMPAFSECVASVEAQHRAWLQHVLRVADACGVVDASATQFAAALNELSAELMPAANPRALRKGVAATEMSAIAPCLAAFAEFLASQAAGSIEASRSIGAALEATLRGEAEKELALNAEGRAAFETAHVARKEIRDKIAKSGDQTKSASSAAYKLQLWALVARLNAAERSKYALVSTLFDGASTYSAASGEVAGAALNAWRARAVAARGALAVASHECGALETRWKRRSSGDGGDETSTAVPEWSPLDAVHEGLMWKESRGVLGVKLLARWFTLRGGVLAYNSDKAQEAQLQTDSPLDVVAVMTHLAVKLVQTPNGGVALQLTLTAAGMGDESALAKKGGTMQLRAATPGETREWAGKLNDHITLLQSIAKGNPRCADCADDLVEWLCIPRDGVVVCARCAEVHTAVRGVETRALSSSHWTSAELAVMQRLGNDKGAALWESSSERRPPTHAFQRDPVAMRVQWITRKYVRREWVDEDGAPAAAPQARVFGMAAADPFGDVKVSARGCGERLVAAAGDGKYDAVVKWRERGGAINFHSERDRLRTPLHSAALADDELAATLLINSGAAIGVVDAALKTPLQLAPNGGAVQRLLTLRAAQTKHDALFVAVLWQAPPSAAKTAAMKGKIAKKKAAAAANTKEGGHGVDGEWTLYRLDDSQPLSFLVDQLNALQPGAHICLSDAPLLELPKVGPRGRFYIAVVLPVADIEGAVHADASLRCHAPSSFCAHVTSRRLTVKASLDLPYVVPKCKPGLGESNPSWPVDPLSSVAVKLTFSVANGAAGELSSVGAAASVGTPMIEHVSVPAALAVLNGAAAARLDHICGLAPADILARAVRNAKHRLPSEMSSGVFDSVTTPNADADAVAPLSAASFAALLRRALEETLQPRLTFGAVDWARRLRIDYDEWIDEYQQRLRRELKRAFIRRRKRAKEAKLPTPATPDYDAAVHIRAPRDVVAMDEAWSALRAALVLAAELHSCILQSAERPDERGLAAQTWLDSSIAGLKL